MTRLLSFTLRVLLLAIAAYGCTRLSLAEWKYAQGMAARSVQASLDLLTDSAEMYPWAFTFRAAQATQLHALARLMPEAVPLALQSLILAVEADPNAPDLISKLYGAQRALGRCEDAAATGKRLIMLVPRSDRAKQIVALPCP